jgi:hypothetical protein
MMQAAAALGQEPLHGRDFSIRLDELDLRLAGSRAQKRHLYLLLRVGKNSAVPAGRQRLGEPRHCGVNTRDHKADMMKR